MLRFAGELKDGRPNKFDEVIKGEDEAAGSIALNGGYGKQPSG